MSSARCRPSAYRASHQRGLSWYCGRCRRRSVLSRNKPLAGAFDSPLFLVACHVAQSNKLLIQPAGSNRTYQICHSSMSAIKDETANLMAWEQAIFQVRASGTSVISPARPHPAPPQPPPPTRRLALQLAC